MSDLKKIPGIGGNMERHLENIGIRCIADLKGKDPEVLYEMDCLQKGFGMTDASCMCSAVRYITRSTNSMNRKS